MVEKARGRVKVTVLGCAGSKYDEGLRLPCSSYLVETEGAAILLDCGFGSFESFVQLATTRIDAIFISHAHADHVADLGAFMDTKKLWRRQPQLLATSETMADIAPSSDALPKDTLVYVAEEDPFGTPTIEAAFSRTTHKMSTHATCISIGGRRVVYSADTGPTWSVPSQFKGADLAIVECTIDERTESNSIFHLDAQEAGMLARELSASRTLLTHIPPGEGGEARLAIAQRIAPSEDFVLATPGLELLVE